MMYQERDSADPLTYGGVTASSDIDIGIEWRQPIRVLAGRLSWHAVL